MSDVVVTVPKGLWAAWLAEGDLAGGPWQGYESHFWFGGHIPSIFPGERVYIVAHNRLRGFAPLIRREVRCELRPNTSCLVRRGDAVAVTIAKPIRGFQGWRYRWWQLEDEMPFQNWKDVNEVLEQ